MNGFDWATIGIIVFELFLGLSVLSTNPKRAVNQSFFLLSCLTLLWVTTLQVGLHGRDSNHVEFLIRLCTVYGSFFPIAFNLIRMAIGNRDISLWGLLRRNRYFILLFLLMSGLAWSPVYLIGVLIPLKPTTFTIPEPIYGKGFLIWVAYFTLSILVVFYLYARDLYRARGGQRLELQFIFWGILSFICVSLLFEIVLPIIRGDSKSVRLGPFCVVGFQTVMAYGIVTKRMLDVGILLRRFVGYALLSAFLMTWYCALWLLTDFALGYCNMDNVIIPGLMATLGIAFAMAPSHNVMQKFVSRVIGNWNGIDPRKVLPETDALLRSVSTTQDVLGKFGQYLVRVTGADSVSVFLSDGNGRYAAYWSTLHPRPKELEASSSLALVMSQYRRPFYVDALLHAQGTVLHEAAISEIRQRQGCLAMAIPGPKERRGLVLLGEKLSGRIYDEDQQSVLQVMVNQLGVALENAALYTAIEQSKRYVETLVDQLLSGVIVVDEAERITVANREALRILRTEECLLGQPLERLPECFRKAVEQVCLSGQPLRDQSALLWEQDTHPVPIRFGCRIFSPDEVMPRGTFLIFDDLTQMKKLEEQLRRSDRLSSLGTLSASVAHEIKNPLVAIKTFVQLVPEKRGDPEFMARFSRLIDGEVSRIDSIVSQMLSFARSDAPKFGEVHIHQVLDNALLLLQHDFEKKNVRIIKKLEAPSDLVWGDRQKLEQVVLNLLFNAREAMPDGGQMLVRTGTSQPGRLEIAFEDEGKGIKQEAMGHIFDPFYTTKETGTGLGLSIAYGIIMEHNGTLELKNRDGGGATALIQLPFYMAETLAA